MQNINSFLAAAKKVGIKDDADLFDADDLFYALDFAKVHDDRFVAVLRGTRGDVSGLTRVAGLTPGKRVNQYIASNVIPLGCPWL